MTDTTESLHTVLTLSQLPRIGRARLKTILMQLAAEGPLIPPLSEVIDRFRKKFFTALRAVDVDAAQAHADGILQQCQAHGIAVHPYGWPSYPVSLVRLTEPPALLFSIGPFGAPVKPRVAVIGTRHPTEWGLETAEACAGLIAEQNGIVVSGLALGIDAAAQQACVARGAQTWAVLAHGLHTISPASNRELADQILEHGGAWVTEYPRGERAQRHYFVERDRIQAGLADAVLVIESGIGGGAMHTVRFANEAQVPVWVTFPHANIAQAQMDPRELSEPHQGTWALLSERRASRVSGLKTLDWMLREISSTPAPPLSSDTLFTR